jgi:DNA-binding MarR family transcriptional regulator
MTNRIDKLEAKGLVCRQSDTADRRSVVVSLTPKGSKLIDKAIQLRLDAADESLQSLTRSERSDLAGLLRKVGMDKCS